MFAEATNQNFPPGRPAECFGRNCHLPSPLKLAVVFPVMLGEQWCRCNRCGSNCRDPHALVDSANGSATLRDNRRESEGVWNMHEQLVGHTPFPFPGPHLPESSLQIQDNEVNILRAQLSCSIWQFRVKGWFAGRVEVRVFFKDFLNSDC